MDSHPLPGVEDLILVTLVRGLVADLEGLGAAVLVGHLRQGTSGCRTNQNQSNCFIEQLMPRNSEEADNSISNDKSPISTIITINSLN